MEPEEDEEVKLAQPVDSNFQRIEIHIKQQLGRGSYGFVCKAKCDKLHCAAKLLHNLFFSSHDPGSQELIKKFKDECRLLSTIVHPCIVQFLGVAMLGNQPILLTELMDESLMSFITRSIDTPLSFQFEVDIIHDIAMGMSYLHSRKILHRDLSSNNVLLSKGSKAKISDFGVSKFFDVDGSFSSLRSKYQTMCPGTPQFMPPEATRSIPVYSDKLDVFSFGVVCLHLLSKCPPTPGLEQEEEIDSLGRVIYVPISELKRREHEISKIDPSHSLLPVSIFMIADKPDERPNADEVCNMIEHVKYSNEYTDSVRNQSTSLSDDKIQIELKTCQNEKRILENELKELKSKEKLASVSVDEIQKLKEENAKLRADLDQLQKQTERQDSRSSVTSDDASSSKSSANNSLEESVTRSMSAGPIEWHEFDVPLPCNFTRGSAISIGDKAYFSRPYSAVVHELDVKSKLWSTLVPCLTEEFSLAVFGDHLIAVGGIDVKTGVCSRSIQRYGLTKTWENDVLPPMFYPHALPSCASSNKFLVVAGGSKGRPPTGPMNSVEIYSKENAYWYCAYSLPKPLSSPVSVIKGDNLFVIGGTSDDGPSWLMYSCSLSYLFKWSNSLMVPVAMRQPWQQVQLPVASPAAALVNDNLLLFGGTMGNEDSYHEYSSHMLKYKEHRRNFGIMMMPRSRGTCLVVTMSQNNSILVLGGCGYNDCIDIGNYT